MHVNCVFQKCANSAQVNSYLIRGVMINRDYDRLVRFTIIWLHVSILVRFFPYLSKSALSESLNCKLRIQISIRCAFFIDNRSKTPICSSCPMLLGKNVAPLPPLENFQIRQTMCVLIVTFSNMAYNKATNDQTIVNPPSFRSAVWKYYGFPTKDGTIDKSKKI